MSGQSKPFISVQPENRTVIEESLEYAWHKAIESLVDPFPELKQPLYTSDEFVSLLAAERGVMDWRPEDTLEQQRKTADKAFEIHRKAGTRHGLSVAMDALDCDIEITPWYQSKEPRLPYSLDVLAWKRNEPATKKVADRILARIHDTKSERDTINFYLAFGLNASFSVAGVSNPITTIGEAKLAGQIQFSPTAEGCIGIGGAGRIYVISDLSPGAIPP